MSNSGPGFLQRLLGYVPDRIARGASGSGNIVVSGSASNVQIELAGAGGVTPGTYGDSTHVAQITVTAGGLITAVTDVAISGGGGGGGVTSIATGTGLTGGPITTTGTISDANTGVTVGSYTAADITVNAQGRITAAANGSAGSYSFINEADGNGFGSAMSLSIPNTYRHLELYLIGDIAGSFPGEITMLLNADSGADYSKAYLQATANTASAANTLAQNFASVGYLDPAYGDVVGIKLTFPYYAQTNFHKPYFFESMANYNATSIFQKGGGVWQSTSAISGISIYTPSGGAWALYSRLSAYGIA